MRRGPVQNIGFAVERAAGSDLLIDIRQQPIRDYIRFQVDSRLLEREFLHRRGIRRLGHLRVEPQVAAGADVLAERAGPVVALRYPDADSVSPSARVRRRMSYAIRRRSG